jgi:Tfp pilus assembly PilM family ATPase
MPGKDKGLVGIELSKDELRAVYVRHRGSKAEVAGASWARMPEGGLAFGVVEQPGIVAISLKKLLDEMRVPSGVPAVIGIPAEGVIVRNLTVPPAPDEDLATIVAGEVEHYRILRTKGSHAYVPLTPPMHGNKGEPISVVVAAAEEHVTRSLGDLAARSDIALAALEPVEFGQLRSVAASLGSEQSAFAVLIGETATDLAVFSKGQLWFYRRVEYGTRQLRPNAPVSPAAFGDIFPDAPPPTAEAPQEFNEAMLDTVASEISRSLEYLSREYKELASFSTLLISVSDPASADIGTHLGERLGLAVDIVSPCSGVPLAPSVASLMNGPDGLRYSAAFGLAIRDMLTFTAALPRVDLFASERHEVQTQILRRNLSGSIVVSALAIVIGIAGYFLYHGRASELEAQATKADEHTKALETEAQSASAQQQLREIQMKTLSGNAVPATAVMDFISSALDPGVGIQSVNITSDRTLAVTAEAQDQASMLRTFDGLRNVPIFQDVVIQNFTTKLNRNDAAAGLTFTVGGRVASLAQVHILSTAPSLAPPSDGSRRTGGVQ